MRTTHQDQHEQAWAARFRAAAEQATSDVSFDAEQVLADLARRHPQRPAPAHDRRRLTGPSAPRAQGRAVFHHGTPWRAGRVLALGAGALALAGVLLIGPGDPGGTSAPLAPAVAAAGVTFTPEGDAVIAEITDPDASAAAMTAAFAEQGYDITVTLVPATSQLVGVVVMTAYDPGRGVIEDAGSRPGCTTVSGASCTTAIRVPAGFSGSGEVAIGRAPRPGEEIIAS
jgi:hypothetical protein